MNQAAKKVLNAALRLPEAERVKVAEELLVAWEGKPEEDVDAAWAMEIERRTREIEQGEVQSIPWSKVRRAVSKRSRAKS